MPDQLTGAKLEKALRGGEFDQAPVELVGMVKASDEDGTIGFSPTDCESWVDVPTDVIETAEHVGHRPCRDHSHPVFRLTLKQSDDPAARIFSTLLASSTRSGRPGSSELGQQWPYLEPPSSGMSSTSGLPTYQPYSRRLGPGSYGPGFGGLNAWGCFESVCCTKWDWVCDAVAPSCIPVCVEREPCTRCIWPW
jgi:hypothetical protein